MFICPFSFDMIKAFGVLKISFVIEYMSYPFIFLLWAIPTLMWANLIIK